MHLPRIFIYPMNSTSQKSSPCGIAAWDLCSGTPHETEYCSQKPEALEGLETLLPALSPAEAIPKSCPFSREQTKSTFQIKHYVTISLIYNIRQV